MNFKEDTNMKASKTPSGKYRVQVYAGVDENGKRIVRSFMASTEEGAILAAYEFKQKYAIGVDPMDMTVEGAINKYIESRTNILSPTTIRSYRLICRTRMQSIMKCKISKLRVIDVQDAINQDAMRLSKKSLKEAVSLLNSALMAQEIYMHLRKRIALPQQRKKIKELPPLNAIIDVIVGTELELPCLLAMWLSLRIAEVRGLKYSDITPDGKRIRVQRERVYNYGTDLVREVNKTEDSTRTNMLPEYIYKMIMAQPHNSDDDFIVQMGYNGLYKGFKREMGKRGYKTTFHDLRHVFATTLNDLGIPPNYIQKLGGWSTDNVMKTVYTHTTSEKEQEYQSRIDNMFASVLEVAHRSDGGGE